jgi:hypothetical protein
MENTPPAEQQKRKLCSAYDTALFEALCSEVVKQDIYKTGTIMDGWKTVAAEMNKW